MRFLLSLALLVLAAPYTDAVAERPSKLAASQQRRVVTTKLPSRSAKRVSPILVTVRGKPTPRTKPTDLLWEGRTGGYLVKVRQLEGGLLGMTLGPLKHKLHYVYNPKDGYFWAHPDRSSSGEDFGERMLPAGLTASALAKGSKRWTEGDRFIFADDEAPELVENGFTKLLGPRPVRSWLNDF